MAIDQTSSRLAPSNHDEELPRSPESSSSTRPDDESAQDTRTAKADAATGDEEQDPRAAMYLNVEPILVDLRAKKLLLPQAVDKLEVLLGKRLEIYELIFRLINTVTSDDVIPDAENICRETIDEWYSLWGQPTSNSEAQLEDAPSESRGSHIIFRTETLNPEAASQDFPVGSDNVVEKRPSRSEDAVGMFSVPHPSNSPPS